MLPLLVYIDVRQVEECNIIRNRPREADLPLGAKERETAGIIDDGVHDGVWVGVRPVHGFAGERGAEGGERDERAVGGDNEAVPVPFLDVGWRLEVTGRHCP